MKGMNKFLANNSLYNSNILHFFLHYWHCTRELTNLRLMMNFQTLFTEHRMCLKGRSITGQLKLCKGGHRRHFCRSALSHPSWIWQEQVGWLLGKCKMVQHTVTLLLICNFVDRCNVPGVGL